VIELTWKVFAKPSRLIFCGGKTMSDLNAQFEKAAQEVMELPRRPDDQTLLKLYGLYKQATEGNIKGKRPGFTDVKGRAKYDAWSRLRGKSPEWAKGEYVKLVAELQSKK
jgi:diazepam-binding inhibitor (GABA receptor modulating acyl-CoA-binding protein)